MKRTLLTLLCAVALAVSANAETALVSFIKTVYEGDVTYEETFPAEDGINDKVLLLVLTQTISRVQITLTWK